MTRSGKSGSRTLLMSVLMSAPGPLILAIGLTAGRSSTQLADLFRRSAELLALVCSYIIYNITQRDGDCDELRRRKLERGANLFVGVVMCLSGIIMIALAIFADSGNKGNVAGGLAVAVLGMIANTLFYFKYAKLKRQSPSAIFAVQCRLYRAKAVVDTCVTIALASVMMFPGSSVSMWLDRIGSVVVALYLIVCGVRTVYECNGGRTDEIGKENTYNHR